MLFALWTLQTAVPTSTFACSRTHLPIAHTIHTHNIYTQTPKEFLSYCLGSWHNYSRIHTRAHPFTPTHTKANTCKLMGMEGGCCSTLDSPDCRSTSTVACSRTYSPIIYTPTPTHTEREHTHLHTQNPHTPIQTDTHPKLTYIHTHTHIYAHRTPTRPYTLTHTQIHLHTHTHT